MKHPLIIFYLLLTLTSCLKSKGGGNNPPPVVTPPSKVQTVFDWNKIADSAQSSLTSFYNTNGKFYTENNVSTKWTQYWPTAHVLDVLVDGYKRTSNQAYKSKMDDLLIGMKAQNGGQWLNFYFDDMEWMTLSCLRAYQSLNDTKYKTISDELWSDIKTNGWSSALGGGVWWTKAYGSKNACSNGPAAIFAARMYKQFSNQTDLEYAKNIYNWEKSVLFNQAGGVYDNIDKNGNVNTNQGWIFTYNQGTFLGAAYELYKITGEPSYLDDAIKAADFAITNLTANGILKDEGGSDGGLFKGIYVRYLTKMIIDGGLPPAKKSNYINFLKTNAQTLWTTGTNKNKMLFSSNWQSVPSTQTDLTTQLSGIMLYEAMAELKANGLVE